MINRPSVNMQLIPDKDCSVSVKYETSAREATRLVHNDQYNILQVISLLGYYFNIKITTRKAHDHIIQHSPVLFSV